jgi:hypothetical protein
VVIGKPVLFRIFSNENQILSSGRLVYPSGITVKLSAVEKTGQYTGHDGSRKVLRGWQDVRGVKFAATDIELLIAGRVMISIAVCVMTTATNPMRRFRPQHFQSIGMNGDGNNQNEHQHYAGNIPYDHTKYVHDCKSGMQAITLP